MGLFSGLSDLFSSGTIKKAVDFAEQTGMVKLPLTSEIKSLEDKLNVLKGFKFRLSTVSKFRLPILSHTQPDKAADIAKQIRQADARAAFTTKLINAALVDGRVAQDKMKFGTFTSKPIAAFMLKKSIADKTYSLAKTLYDNVWSNWTLAQRQMFSAGDLPVYKQVGQAAYGTIREAAEKATNVLVSTGKAAEDAITGAGELAPYAKYAVPAGLVFLGLYALSFIPKPSRD